MEMTRWSLGKLKEETGVGTVDVANRMADYGHRSLLDEP